MIDHKRKPNKTSFKPMENHPRWNGGVKIVSSGNGKVQYRKMRVNSGKYISEHRLIMEKFLGRKLRLDEVVHHKNGNGLDNRFRNLQLMTKKQHDLLGQHNRKRKDLICGCKNKDHLAKGMCKECYDRNYRLKMKNNYA